MTVQVMTSAEVTKKVIDKEELFILDVRNQDAFSDWKIEGEKFSYLNVPYFELLDLNMADETEFRKMVTENLPPQPNAYQEIRQTNMGKMSPDEEKQREMEIRPNRCAVR